jgi:hypothetical protein
MALARSCLLLTNLCSIPPSLGTGMRSCFQRRGLAVGLIDSLDLVKSDSFSILLYPTCYTLGSPFSPSCGLMTSLTRACNVCSVGPKGRGIFHLGIDTAAGQLHVVYACLELKENQLSQSINGGQFIDRCWVQTYSTWPGTSPISSHRSFQSR